MSIATCAEQAFVGGYRYFQRSRIQTPRGWAYFCEVASMPHGVKPDLEPTEGHVIGRCSLSDKRCMGLEEFVIEHDRKPIDPAVVAEFDAATPKECMEAVMKHNWQNTEFGSDRPVARAFAWSTIPDVGTSCQALKWVVDVEDTPGTHVGFLGRRKDNLAKPSASQNITCDMLYEAYAEYMGSCTTFEWHLPRRTAWGWVTEKPVVYAGARSEEKPRSPQEVIAEWSDVFV